MASFLVFSKVSGPMLNLQAFPAYYCGTRNRQFIIQCIMDGLLTKRDTPPSQGVKLVNQLDSQRMYNNYYYANVLSLVRDILKI